MIKLHPTRNIKSLIDILLRLIQYVKEKQKYRGITYDAISFENIYSILIGNSDLCLIPKLYVGMIMIKTSKIF